MPGRLWQLLALLLIVFGVCCSRGEPIRERAAVRHVATRAGEGVSVPAAAGIAEAGRGPLEPFEFDPLFFRKKGAPEPGEWLAEHREYGQTFLEFQRTSTLKPTVERRTIVLQPLGAFSAEQRATLTVLQRATTVYFGLPVEIAETQPLPTRGRRLRKRDNEPLVQYLTAEILASLSRTAPDHAIAYLGVTFQDLYPEPSWNFVFGEAELAARVGVYSLIRFTPEFNHEAKDEAARQRFTRRAIQLLGHEAGHIFGIHHCTAFECVMNGSNSLSESDRAPLEPCHECLHKLAFALGLRPLPRYLELGRLYEELGLGEDARWSRARAASLTPPHQ
jgi:archaemetzincin